MKKKPSQHIRRRPFKRVPLLPVTRKGGLHRISLTGHTTPRMQGHLSRNLQSCHGTHVPVRAQDTKTRLPLQSRHTPCRPLTPSNRSDIQHTASFAWVLVPLLCVTHEYTSFRPLKCEFRSLFLFSVYISRADSQR